MLQNPLKCMAPFFGQKTSARKSFGWRSIKRDLLVDQSAVNHIWVGEMSVGQMSVGQMSVCQMSVGQMPVGQMSVGQMSVGQMVFDQKSWGQLNSIILLQSHVGKHRFMKWGGASLLTQLKWSKCFNHRHLRIYRLLNGTYLMPCLLY